ncbi:MAG: winged helix DNA-binding domain-containing protein, partial [Prevotellaceae bacterium]|nr:winged helix DNA-binding domain-containing protein [Prevotellaceae bacterium]
KSSGKSRDRELEITEALYALLSERAPAARPLPKEESLARLADIYFRSHSPATLQDFAWWSGLPLTEARSGLEAAKEKLVAASIGEKTYWINPACSDAPGAPPKTSVLFLPAFDEYIIAYSDRSAIIPAGCGKAISSNGVFRPTIVVNGQVAGIWKKTASKAAPIQADFFAPPGKAVQEAAGHAMSRVSKLWAP